MANDSFEKTPETDRKRIAVETIGNHSTINKPTVMIPKPGKDLHPGVSPRKSSPNISAVRGIKKEGTSPIAGKVKIKAANR